LWRRSLPVLNAREAVRLFLDVVAHDQMLEEESPAAVGGDIVQRVAEQSREHGAKGDVLLGLRVHNVECRPDACEDVL
jgi:hypothetical protein